MAKMIQHGNELIRICPSNPMRLEYSRDNGHNWMGIRYYGSGNIGTFLELTDAGNEILAQTTVGLCYSRDNGANFNVRSRG